MIRILTIIIVANLLCIPKFVHGQARNLEPVCAQSRGTYGVNGFVDSEFFWSVEGGTIIRGNGTNEVEIQWGYTTGNFRIEVLELSDDSCYGTPQVAFVDVMAPGVNLGYDFYDLCEGDEVTFNASGNYIEPAIFEWHDGSNEETFTSNTTEIVWVRVTDDMGCFRYDSVDVDVHPLPTVDLGNDTVLCDEENPLLLNAGYHSSYAWQSTQGIYSTENPLILFPSKVMIDTISVVVSTPYDCEASDSMVLYPCDIEGIFAEMSNTITPNGDGYNDVWNIKYVENFPNAVLEVFDRWGRLVYRTENVALEPWDGKSNGRVLPMDSYYFVLELNYAGTKPITGTVNIIQ